MSFATFADIRPEIRRRLAEAETLETALQSPHDLAGECSFCRYLGYCAIIRLPKRRIRLICADCRAETRQITQEEVRERAEAIARSGGDYGRIPGNEKSGTPESERDELRGW